MPEIVRHYVVGLRSGDVVARDGSSPKMSWHLAGQCFGCGGLRLLHWTAALFHEAPATSKGRKKTTPRLPRAGKGAVTGGAVGALRFVCDAPVRAQCARGGSFFACASLLPGLYLIYIISIYPAHSEACTTR